MAEWVLRGAQALLEIPERWTQGAFARTASGVIAGPEDDDAVCFCPLAAITRAAEGDATARRAAEKALALVIERPPLPSFCRQIPTVIVWNDQVERTHDDVIAAFDRAIAGYRDW